MNPTHPPFAILFPGQGSQQIGMGESFRDRPEFQSFLERGNQLFHGNLIQAIYQGSAEQLTQTQFAQPALFTVEMGISHVFCQQTGRIPAYVAGHSLGEYTALVTAGVLSFEAAFQLVVTRSQAMQGACERYPGTMVAVLKPDLPLIETLCHQPPYEGRVVIGNYNSSQQVILSGANQLLEQMIEELKSKGMKHIRSLPVSGAFHSPLMQDAQHILNKAIDSSAFVEAQIPVVTNVDGEITTSGEELKNKLKRQLTHPVQWEKSVHTMVQAGVSYFIEIGPGHVLSNLIKRIVPDCYVDSIAQLADLDTLIPG